MNRAIAWFVRNPVAANLLAALLVLGGILAIPVLRLEVFPEIEPDLVTVRVEYLGAAPQEVEEGVCIRIEEALQGLAGVERITSLATEGMAVVTVEMLPGEDRSAVLDEIKSRVDAIDTLPEETERPVVTKVFFRRPVVDVALHGHAEEATLKELAEQVRDGLLSQPEITLVELAGVRDYEISIEVSEEMLRRYQLRFDDVARAVGRSSLDLPGGTLKTRGGEILLRAKGQAYRGEEFERLPLMVRADGTRVTVGDVARVVDGFEDEDRWSYFDGEPAVLLQVFRVGEQSTPDIARAVQRFVASGSERLPEGISITTWQDDSLYFRGRLATLRTNGFLGLLLVIGVLALFMRLRLASWVSLGLPISLFGAIAVLPVLDISVNIVSLFAFIMVIGILVDDAIVVGENVYTHRRRAPTELDAWSRAAETGAQEVSTPVVFGVLTTLVAFASLVFLPGNFGQIFANLPLVVIACIFFSLLASLFILPAHLGQLRPDALRHTEGWWVRVQERVSAALDRLVERRYCPLLDRALGARFAVVAGALMLLLWGMAWVGGGWIRFTFFPPVEAEVISALVTMPMGAPVERTAEAIAQIEAAADRVRRSVEGDEPEPGERIYRHVLASVGQQPYLQRQLSQGGSLRGDGISGAHLGEVSIELTPSEERSIRATEIRDLWRAESGPVADAVELVFEADRFGAGQDIDVQLAGPDVDELREVAELLQAQLATYPGVSDIANSFRGGKQEIRLAILPSAEALGLSLEDLARQVRQAFYGEEVQRIQRGRDDVRVMVRYPEHERRALGDLDNLRVRTPDGAEVPFAAVARARRERGYAAIQRADRVRVVHVTAAVDEAQANANEILADLRRGTLAELSALHPRVSYSLEGAQREQRDVLFGILRSFVLALLSIYALLAVPLRSYVQPLIVMSAIPFGLLGALVGHLLLGFELSLLSLFGMVALSGVVVNSSLVYLDFINRRRAAGASVSNAIRDAARGRFRPVVLTALTTFAGLAPVLVERSAQAQFIIPMAISLGFGVVFATAITLVLVPCMVAILAEDLPSLRLVARVRRGAAALDTPEH